MKKLSLIIITLALAFSLACSLPGGSPTQSVRQEATLAPTMQLTPPTREATGTPIIISPTANEQVNPTVDPSVFETETIAPTPTACEALKEIFATKSFNEIVSLLGLNAVSFAPDNSLVPAGSIYWSPNVISVSTELATIIRTDTNGTILRIIQDTTFTVAGYYVKDPCAE